ncbi:BatA and WFA domain-containing protein [Stieleria sp. TO1_6]|uniref:vWA domain-containing protein n=1 Tax=Stieleria tagensis TaxID=2956795 RepID=UPI00209B9AD6|nr:BatA and WFA domain-containing protein [Stieleria tagensis]MCO8122244.1 BatA and WFA domain-containing protein [Stieleria tagensis]
MSLASPSQLIWLLAALPIILFYILKTRLRRRPVSTLLFWDQVFEQKRQRSLWQNLRHWVSLLLQLALVGLIGFALADPLWNSQQDSGQDLILVVDNSASMQAVDPQTGQSRLQQAIVQATDLAGTLRNGDNIALVTAGNSVRVVVGMSDFAPTVQEALGTITPTDGPTRIADGIAAARRLASDDKKRRIVVFSDGGVPDRDALEAVASSASDDSSDELLDDLPEDVDLDAASTSRQQLLGKDVRWIQVGRSQDNVAITTFQVRRSTVDPIGYSLLVEVRNFSDAAVETRLTLRLDEELVDVIPLEIEADASFRKQIDGTSQAGGVLSGEIKHDDALIVDNTARAILPRRNEIPVHLVVGDQSDSYYMRRVLQSIPLVRILGDDEISEPTTRLTVFANHVPDQIPDGPVLFVDVPKAGPAIGDDKQPAWQLGEAIENPIIAKQEKQSPLLRHVQLQNVILAGGRDLEVNEALGTPTTLLETASGARVCVSVERNEGRVLLLASDLDSSDLPLRIAFPVLMTNAMNWFFRETGEIRPALATGQTSDVPWDIAAQSSAASASAGLVAPSGQRSIVTVAKNRARLGPLAAVGIYRLTTDQTGSQTTQGNAAETEPDASQGADTVATAEEDDAAGTLIAVNLSDANESDLRVPQMQTSETAALPPAGRSPWFYLILAATGLVITEWALFQRRVVA